MISIEQNVIYWTVKIRHQFSYQTQSEENTTTYRNKIGILLYLFKYREHSNFNIQIKKNLSDYPPVGESGI